MRLRSIEAVRYGVFSSAALGELRDGLNVVLGRNEAGKSTFTSLVRHVLYGFPRGRTSERLYKPPGGEQRVGRLVFSDDDSLWVVERTEGAHGGTAIAHGPQGEAPEEVFLEPITRGVSATVFRTVFGFALEELSDLGSLQDIQSRLYATATGLRVNPHDVLDTLRGRADELWAPKAYTKRIHKLDKDLRRVREERRLLEETAERYREDRERRVAVAELLAQAEEDMRVARLNDERLAARLDAAKRLAERVREDTDEAEARRAEAKEKALEAAALDVDEDLLSRVEELDRLAARCELFTAEAKIVRQDEARLNEVDADLLRRAAELGDSWTLDAAKDFELESELEGRLDEAEEKIRSGRRERDDSARRATEKRAEHREALEVARQCAEDLGLVDEDDPEHAAGLRLETVDRLLAVGGSAHQSAASWVPGAAAAAIAVVIIGAGLVLGDRMLAGAGALPGLLAAVLLWRTWLERRRGLTPEAEALLPVLGFDDLPEPAELMGMKHAFEACRRAWESAREVGRAAAARESAAREAAARLESVWVEWLAWLEETGLRTPSQQPSSVRRLVHQLRELRARIEARGDLRDQIDRRRAICEEFVVQAREHGVVPHGLDAVAAFEEVEHQVRTLLGRLSLARRTAETRKELETAAKLAEERAAAAQARVEAARVELAALLEGADGVGEATLSDLEAASAVARQRASEAKEERDGLLEERATLDGKLQRGAEESASAALRQRQAGLVERLAEALESYAVLTTAVGLLEESLAAYEAERQPEVIRRAQEIFSALTGGRYTRLATPLGQFAPSVADASAVGKAPDQLSRATAEQLFLALRLSYIENLADAHPALPVLMDDVLVNFDDDRRRAAVRVIAEFATRRQVVFFTCHPATVQAFAEEAGEHTQLELG